MRYQVFSYRYAKEILQHKNFRGAWEEIDQIVSEAPVFEWPGKSKKNPRLCVVQQVMNTYFERLFVTEHEWEFHPLATRIPDSKLTADFRKKFVGPSDEELVIQVEVQFGNMGKWYSDIFKFQSAYSDKYAHVGLSIVPMHEMAKLIDSNVAYFERARRELPSAELSITLPILLLGLEYENAETIDLSRSHFDELDDVKGKGGHENQRRIVHAYLSDTPIEEVSSESEPGPEINPPPSEE